MGHATWDTEPGTICWEKEHLIYAVISAVVFPLYLVVVLRLAVRAGGAAAPAGDSPPGLTIPAPPLGCPHAQAAFNDLTQLTELKDEMPPSGQKLRELFFNKWRPTKVTLGGPFTRRRETGGQFVICRQVAIVAFLTGSVVFTKRRYVALPLWLSSALLLFWSTFVYQPFMEPRMCIFLAVCRAVVLATFSLSIVRWVWVVGDQQAEFETTTGDSQRMPVREIWSLIFWIPFTLCAMLATYLLARRWPWHRPQESVTVPADHQPATVHGAGPVRPHRRASNGAANMARSYVLAYTTMQVAPYSASNGKDEEPSRSHHGSASLISRLRGAGRRARGSGAPSSNASGPSTASLRPQTATASAGSVGVVSQKDNGRRSQRASFEPRLMQRTRDVPRRPAAAWTEVIPLAPATQPPG